MTEDAGALFKSLTVKGFEFRNRIVMPPMVTNRGIATDAGVRWYGEHAAGGPALVIVEATSVTLFGASLTVQNLARLTQAIHDGGALAAIQLFPIEFSFPRKPGSRLAPGDLSDEQIDAILKDYERAARLCAEAGFDGVEPHGAHGYLINQFFSPVDNPRTDRFGGSLENRMRFGLEVTRSTRKGLGDDRLLLYRHTPVKDGSYGIEESLAFADKLVAEGVDVLDISPASAEAPADLAEPFRRFGVPVIGVNEMDEIDRAVEALTQGRADLVAVGRALIADPLWPNKAREGRLDEVVKCIRCNEKCFGNLREGIPIECTQW